MGVVSADVPSGDEGPQLLGGTMMWKIRPWMDKWPTCKGLRAGRV